jgi:hypothetical protein
VGLFDTRTGTFQDDAFDPDQQDYATWSLTGFKEWYLPKFQKVKLELSYLCGSNLDRYSEYQFSSFVGGPSLPGFSGSGVRFDEGAIGARVVVQPRERDSASRCRGRATRTCATSSAASRSRIHTGVGLSFNVIGRGRRSGRELRARDRLRHPALEGQQEFGVLVLKLF